MNIILYVFMALVVVLLNEFRLIKKYVRAHENNFEKTNLQKMILFILKPIVGIKNWINHKLLNDELTYN